MADQTEGSIVIDAEPAQVMATIADYEAYPEWASGVQSVLVLERDSEGRGTRVRFQVAQGPVKLDYTLAYSYSENDRGVSWTFVEGSGVRDLTGRYALTPQSGGKTKVTYRLRVESAIPMLGFMKRKAERMVIDTALKGLKARVESRA